MGASKTTGFPNREKDIAALARALAHPARVAIVEYLLQAGSCICGDIVNQLPLAQATVSQHLKELKKAGLIQGEIEGNTVCYCLNKETIKRLHDYLASVMNRLINANNCC